MLLSYAGHGHVADSGDLADGSYIEIKDGNPQLSWIIPEWHLVDGLKGLTPETPMPIAQKLSYSPKLSDCVGKDKG
jgi:hypothetical protein